MSTTNRSQWVGPIISALTLLVVLGTFFQTRSRDNNVWKRQDPSLLFEVVQVRPFSIFANDFRKSNPALFKTKNTGESEAFGVTYEFFDIATVAKNNDPPQSQESKLYGSNSNSVPQNGVIYPTGFPDVFTEFKDDAVVSAEGKVKIAWTGPFNGSFAKVYKFYLVPSSDDKIVPENHVEKKSSDKFVLLSPIVSDGAR